MTTDKTALDALLPCPFQRGQVWSNPDNMLMLITSVRTTVDDHKIEYIDEDGNCGSFYTSDKTIVNNIEPFNTRPQPSGDAVQVWCVYKSEDDSHHIFSTKENAEIFANSTTEPIVIYDYIIDHPERYYERTN